MPRAAPGEVYREALHRPLPNEILIPEKIKLRYGMMCSVRVGMEPKIHPKVQQLISSFTLHNPGFRVERGRLGEVESLVGDCRPPPPGNPRRPICGTSLFKMHDRHGINPVSCAGWFTFLPDRRKDGGVSLLFIRRYSFNRYKKLSNLKKLARIQNFKNIRSFLSCTDRMRVLRFGRSPSHLYGTLQVGTPPIVITSVLNKKDGPYALSVLSVR
jgi:hypothetical protein